MESTFKTDYSRQQKNKCKQYVKRLIDRSNRLEEEEEEKTDPVTNPILPVK